MVHILTAAILLALGIIPTVIGDKDDLIPYSQSVRFHAKLNGAGVPNQLVTIKDRGHGGFTEGEWTNAHRSIREFLAKNALR